jgi:hypothetical protein
VKRHGGWSESHFADIGEDATAGIAANFPEELQAASTID